MCGRRRAHEVYNKSVRCPQGAKSELHSHIRCSPERFKNKLSVPLNHQSSCSTLAFGVSWFELGDTAEKVLSTQRVSCCLMKAKRRKYTWSRSMNLGLRLCLGLQQSQVADGGLKSASFPFFGNSSTSCQLLSRSSSLASHLSGIDTRLSASEYTQSCPASSQDGQGNGGFPAQRVLRLRQRLHLFIFSALVLRPSQPGKAHTLPPTVVRLVELPTVDVIKGCEVCHGPFRR